MGGRGGGAAKRFLDFLRESPGRGPALAFMALLLGAAAYLAAGDEDTANRLAEYAYYALVIAVASELVWLARHRESDGEGRTGQSRSWRWS